MGVSRNVKVEESRSVLMTHLTGKTYYLTNSNLTPMDLMSHQKSLIFMPSSQIGQLAQREGKSERKELMMKAISVKKRDSSRKYT